jgi:hypothetical protein
MVGEPAGVLLVCGGTGGPRRRMNAEVLSERTLARQSRDPCTQKSTPLHTKINILHTKINALAHKNQHPAHKSQDPAHKNQHTQPRLLALTPPTPGCGAANNKMAGRSLRCCLSGNSPVTSILKLFSHGKLNVHRYTSSPHQQQERVLEDEPWDAKWCSNNSNETIPAQRRLGRRQLR